MNQRKIGVVLNYFILGLNLIMGLVYTPYMLSKIGDSQYGINALTSSLIALVSMLDLGFGQTLVRYSARARANGDTAEENRLNGMFLKLYIAIAGVAVIVGVIIVIVYPRIAADSFTSEEIHLFRIVFSILICNVAVSFPLSVFSAAINVREEFLVLKLTNFCMLIVRYAVLFLLLYLGYKLIAMTVVTLLASLATQLIYVLYAIKKLEIHFDFEPCKSEYKKEIYLFSFYIFLNLIIDFLYSNIDKLILGAVSGTIAVAIYSIGVTFCQYFSDLSTAMSSVFMPRIVELNERNARVEISAVFNQVGRYQMMLLFLVLGGFTCLGKEFISLWVGDSYRDSYVIGLLIMLPSIVPLTQSMGISVIRAMNIHKYRSYMYITIAILNVALSIPLSIKYDGIGAAIGTTISTLLGQILFMNVFYSRCAYLDIRTYWKNFGKFLALSLFPIIAVGSVKRYALPDVISWGQLGLLIVLFTVIYGVLYLMFVADDYEKQTYRGIVGKVLNK